MAAAWNRFLTPFAERFGIWFTIAKPQGRYGASFRVCFRRIRRTHRAVLYPQRRTLVPGRREADAVRHHQKQPKEESMNDDDRTKEALFRHAVLGDVLSRKLKRGDLAPLLAELSEKTFEDYRGRPRQMAVSTLQEWLYNHRHGGFEGLKPLPRSDAGSSRKLSAELEQLTIDLKREDPGRSAPLILRELELSGRINRGAMSVYPIQRLLRRHGLSGPRMELDVPARFRWQASMCGELWQADALHP
jgi:hypothetical protein